MTVHDVKVIREQIENYENYAKEEYNAARALMDKGDKEEAYRLAQINEAKAIALADLLQLLGLYNV